MVGIAGRSKGCQTCKKRRVKCDERQPTCTRCEKGGFECLGYTKALQIVSENSRARKNAETQAAARLRVAESDRTPQPESVELVLRSTPSISPENRFGYTFAESQIEAAKVQPQLSLSAFKESIQISYTTSKIFSGLRSTPDLLQLGYNKKEFVVSSHALRALSSAYFGRMHHVSEAETDGRMHYGKTLRAMSEVLASEEALSLPVLVGGFVASCYEMIASRDHDGILSHAGGIGKLLELRGPEQHCSESERLLLIYMRIPICTKALLDRKRTFLEREEWKTVPWSLEPDSKTMVDYIQDILCDMPGLLEDLEVVRSAQVPEKELVSRVEKLKTDLYDHFRLIYEWRAVWEQANPAACIEKPSLMPDSPFPTVLHYKHLDQANALMIYNAILLKLILIAKGLIGPDFDQTHPAQWTPFFVTNPALQRIGATPYDAAIEVLRSVEYHLTPPHENAGAFLIIFPLKFAYDALPKSSTEYMWVKETMRKISEISGFHFTTGLLQRLHEKAQISA